MAIQEVVDRKIEVEGSLGWLYFRKVEDRVLGDRVHVTAAADNRHWDGTGARVDVPQPFVGLGEFSADELREALDRL